MVQKTIKTVKTIKSKYLIHGSRENLAIKKGTEERFFEAEA